MTRRRRLLVVALLLVLLLAAGQGWMLIPPDPVSQIKPGMTVEEVDAIFGHPGTLVGEVEVNGATGLCYVWGDAGRWVTVEFSAQEFQGRHRPVAATGVLGVAGTPAPSLTASAPCSPGDRPQRSQTHASPERVPAAGPDPRRRFRPAVRCRGADIHPRVPRPVRPGLRLAQPIETAARGKAAAVSDQVRCEHARRARRSRDRSQLLGGTPGLTGVGKRRTQSHPASDPGQCRKSPKSWDSAPGPPTLSLPGRK